MSTKDWNIPDDFDGPVQPGAEGPGPVRQGLATGLRVVGGFTGLAGKALAPESAGLSLLASGGLSGLAEILAQSLENYGTDRSINWPRVGVEATIGSIPAPTKGLAALKGAALGYSGVAGRRFTDNSPELANETLEEKAVRSFDPRQWSNLERILGPGLGAAGGAVGQWLSSSRKGLEKLGPGTATVAETIDKPPVLKYGPEAPFNRPVQALEQEMLDRFQHGGQWYKLEPSKVSEAIKQLDALGQVEAADAARKAAAMSGKAGDDILDALIKQRQAKEASIAAEAMRQAKLNEQAQKANMAAGSTAAKEALARTVKTQMAEGEDLIFKMNQANDLETLGQLRAQFDKFIARPDLKIDVRDLQNKIKNKGLSTFGKSEAKLIEQRVAEQNLAKALADGAEPQVPMASMGARGTAADGSKLSTAVRFAKEKPEPPVPSQGPVVEPDSPAGPAAPESVIETEVIPPSAPDSPAVPKLQLPTPSVEVPAVAGAGPVPPITPVTPGVVGGETKTLEELVAEALGKPVEPKAAPAAAVPVPEKAPTPTKAPAAGKAPKAPKVKGPNPLADPANRAKLMGWLKTQGVSDDVIRQLEETGNAYHAAVPGSLERTEHGAKLSWLGREHKIPRAPVGFFDKAAEAAPEVVAPAAPVAAAPEAALPSGWVPETPMPPRPIGQQAFDATRNELEGLQELAASLPAGPVKDNLLEKLSDKDNLLKEMLVRNLDYFKGKGAAGKISPELAVKLGMSATGAAVGSAVDKENRLRGAALGAGLGYGVLPAIIAAQNAHIPTGALDNLGDKFYEASSKALKYAPTVQRSFMLWNPRTLGANAILGPVGSGTMSALERGLAGVLKMDPDEIGISARALKNLYSPEMWRGHFREGFEDALERISANERGEGLWGAGDNLAEKTLKAPSMIMAAGDQTVRKLLQKAGYSATEADKAVLTSEPLSGVGKALENFARRGPINQLLLPFHRTAINAVEGSVDRAPVIGLIKNLFDQKAGRASVDLQTALARQLVGVGGMGLSYGLGQYLDPTTAKALTAGRGVSNFGGQYGPLLTLAFAAGQGMRKPEPGSVGRSLLYEAQNILPLPTSAQYMDLGRNVLNYIETGQASPQAKYPFQRYVPKALLPAFLTDSNIKWMLDNPKDLEKAVRRTFGSSGNHNVPSGPIKAVSTSGSSFNIPDDF
jgi:hypothetical protein